MPAAVASGGAGDSARRPAPANDADERVAFSEDGDALNVFITVGSTRFDALIAQSVLNTSFLKALQDQTAESGGLASLRKVHVVAQYGNSDIAEALLQSSLSDAADGDSGADGQVSLRINLPGRGSSIVSSDGTLHGSLKLASDTDVGVDISLFKFAPDLQSYMRAAHLIISHAGSGTIIEALRLPPSGGALARQLIVVPNETLMDNHQVELAEALADEVTGPYVHLAKVGELPHKVGTVLAAMREGETVLKPFPAFDGSRLLALVDEEMGF